MEEAIGRTDKLSFIKKISWCGALPVWILAIILTAVVLSWTGPAMAKDQLRIGILMANDIRQDPVNGFTDGLGEYSKHGTFDFVYTILNAKNHKERLPDLAREIIDAKPDIAVAAGGIEADALKAAAKGTQVPVVFLSVSSSISRGLASSMTAPDNNITGVETNDTELTAKRLWFIKRILPNPRTVFCYHVPSIVPSVESIGVAQKKAQELGLDLIVEPVETVEDIRKVTQTLSRDKVDVILLNPVAPIHGAVETIILPKAMAEKIPIFGYGMGSIKAGAFASYAGNRYANGRQAARLAHKIVHGALPKDIPIETPEELEFIVNRWMVKALGLQLPDRAWQMADKIVDIDLHN